MVQYVRGISPAWAVVFGLLLLPIAALIAMPVIALNAYLKLCERWPAVALLLGVAVLLAGVTITAAMV